MVLLSYHFPPSAEVGALRAAKVARAFADRGHEVTVIRAAGEEKGHAAEPHPLIAVETVVPAAAPRDWYAEIKRAMRGDGTESAAGEAAPPEAWVPPTRVGALRRLILSLMWLPDDRQGFIWIAAKAAIQALRRGGPGTVLLSSSPPHSAQVAALLAQIATGAPWVVEWRDPWTDNPGKPWYCRTGLTDAVERWLERRCLTRARLVVSVSEGIHRLVRDKLGTAGASKAVLVRNGIDAIHDGAPARAPGRPFRILHVGTLYLGRDPRPFLRALAAVVARRGLRPDDVVLELVGKGEWFDGVSLKDFAAGLGLEPYVGFVPWLPHAEVERRLRAADLLLLLAERQPLQVPNKLYEYLGARRPMLVFADPDGETARMVRAVGGHHLVRSEDPAIDAVVERAITSPPAGPVGSRALLEEWGTARQMAGLVAAVGRLGEPTPAF